MMGIVSFCLLVMASPVFARHPHHHGHGGGFPMPPPIFIPLPMPRIYYPIEVVRVAPRSVCYQDRWVPEQWRWSRQHGGYVLIKPGYYKQVRVRCSRGW